MKKRILGVVLGGLSILTVSPLATNFKENQIEKKADQKEDLITQPQVKTEVSIGDSSSSSSFTRQSWYKVNSRAELITKYWRNSGSFATAFDDWKAKNKEDVAFNKFLTTSVSDSYYQNWRDNNPDDLNKFYQKTKDNDLSHEKRFAAFSNRQIISTKNAYAESSRSDDDYLTWTQSKTKALKDHWEKTTRGQLSFLAKSKKWLDAKQSHLSTLEKWSARQESNPAFNSYSSSLESDQVLLAKRKGWWETTSAFAKVSKKAIGVEEYVTSQPQDFKDFFKRLLHSPLLIKGLGDDQIQVNQLLVEVLSEIGERIFAYPQMNQDALVTASLQEKTRYQEKWNQLLDVIDVDDEIKTELIAVYNHLTASSPLLMDQNYLLFAKKKFKLTSHSENYNKEYDQWIKQIKWENWFATYKDQIESDEKWGYDAFVTNLKTKSLAEQRKILKSFGTYVYDVRGDLFLSWAAPSLYSPDYGPTYDQKNKEKYDKHKILVENEFVFNHIPNAPRISFGSSLVGKQITGNILMQKYLYERFGQGLLKGEIDDISPTEDGQGWFALATDLAVDGGEYDPDYNHQQLAHQKFYSAFKKVIDSVYDDVYEYALYREELELAIATFYPSYQSANYNEDGGRNIGFGQWLASSTLDYNETLRVRRAWVQFLIDNHEEINALSDYNWITTRKKPFYEQSKSFIDVAFQNVAVEQYQGALPQSFKQFFRDYLYSHQKVDNNFTLSFATGGEDITSETSLSVNQILGLVLANIDDKKYAYSQLQNDALLSASVSEKTRYRLKWEELLTAIDSDEEIKTDLIALYKKLQTHGFKVKDLHYQAYATKEFKKDSFQTAYEQDFTNWETTKSLKSYWSTLPVINDEYVAFYKQTYKDVGGVDVYNDDLDAWSQTKTNGLAVYKTSSALTNDFSRWEDNFNTWVSDFYLNSEVYQQDKTKWFANKTLGTSAYNESGQADKDHHQWSLSLYYESDDYKDDKDQWFNAIVVNNPEHKKLSYYNSEPQFDFNDELICQGDCIGAATLYEEDKFAWHEKFIKYYVEENIKEYRGEDLFTRDELLAHQDQIKDFSNIQKDLYTWHLFKNKAAVLKNEDQPLLYHKALRLAAISYGVFLSGRMLGPNSEMIKTFQKYDLYEFIPQHKVIMDRYRKFFAFGTLKWIDSKFKDYEKIVAE